jgi:hypothetical protein
VENTSERLSRAAQWAIPDRAPFIGRPNINGQSQKKYYARIIQYTPPDDALNAK